MKDTDHNDGDIVSALRGLVTSIAANRYASSAVVMIGAVAAAFGWAMLPGSVGSYQDSVVLPSSDGSLKALLAVIGFATLAVVGTVVPLWIQLHRAWLEKKLDEERLLDRAELVALIRSYLTPAIENLPKITKSGSDGSNALADAKRTLLNAAAAVCGPTDSGVRAVWFGVEGKTLVAMDWVGGSCSSKRRFANHHGSAAGTAVWETARLGEPRLYPDLSKDAPPGYVRSPTSDYETFITCGVLNSKGEVIGMLNVDAPHPLDLTKVDSMIVGVCAKVMSTAHALSEPHGIVN